MIEQEYNYLDTLKAEIYESGGRQVIPNRALNIPEINKNKLRERFPSDTDIENILDEVVDLVDMLRDWYIITDKFTTHHERSEWRDKMRLKYGDEMWDTIRPLIKGNNKLRLAWTGAIAGVLWALIKDCQGSGKEKMLREAVRKVEQEATLGLERGDKEFFGPIYDSLNIEQKIERVHRIEDAVVELLKVILE